VHGHESFEDLLSLLNLREISTSLEKTSAFVKISFLKRKHSIIVHSFAVTDQT